MAKKVALKDGRSVKMQLWDTAGQERFRAMAPMYYRNAASAIICFDITNQESFNKMMDWVEELRRHMDSGAQDLVLAIACNKCDLESERVVSKARAKQFADKVDALFFETSAKEGAGVNELFQKITESVIQSKGYLTRVDSQVGLRPTGHILDQRPPQQKPSSCC